MAVSPAVLVPVIVVPAGIHFVVSVELPGERHAVTAVVQRHAGAREELVARPADTGPRVGRLGGGVLDRPQGRGVVLGPPHAAAGPVVHAVPRVLQADVGACLRVRAPHVGAQLRPRALEQRLAVALLGCDHVDEPADRVRAVQQRCRPAHDLDAFRAVGVDRDAMVAGLARQVSGADAVLQDQHPVAVEAADDRPARSGAEAADRNARLVPQGVSETGGRLSCDVERVHGGDRVERLEGRLGSARRGGHRHVLANGREFEYEIHRRGLAWIDGHRLPSRGQVLALREDFVGAGRHALDCKPSLFVGQREVARAHNEDDRAVNGAVFLHCHGALHPAGLLGQDRRRRKDRHRRRCANTCRQSVHCCQSVRPVHQIPFPSSTLRDPVPVSIVQGPAENASGNKHPGRAQDTTPPTGVGRRHPEPRSAANRHIALARTLMRSRQSAPSTNDGRNAARDGN